METSHSIGYQTLPLISRTMSARLRWSWCMSWWSCKSLILAQMAEPGLTLLSIIKPQNSHISGGSCKGLTNISQTVSTPWFWLYSSALSFSLSSRMCELGTAPSQRPTTVLDTSARWLVHDKAQCRLEVSNNALWRACLVKSRHDMPHSQGLPISSQPTNDIHASGKALNRYEVMEWAASSTERLWRKSGTYVSENNNLRSIHPAFHQVPNHDEQWFIPLYLQSTLLHLPGCLRGNTFGWAEMKFPDRIFGTHYENMAYFISFCSNQSAFGRLCGIFQVRSCFRSPISNGNRSLLRMLPRR